MSDRLGDITTEALAAQRAPSAVALVPIGSTEPHGPHLPLATDAILSEEACARAAEALSARELDAWIAPTIAYGVTRYATGFRGAIGVSEATLEALLCDVAGALLDDGFAHVVFVNNHLEPEHVATIARATEKLRAARGAEAVVFANQLDRRWGRTLTDEFKRGDCHAGCYETSLMLAARPELVRGELARALPALPISLAQAIRDAQRGGGARVRFASIGMDRAYTGAPAAASREEGEATYARLVEMIVTEVTALVAAPVQSRQQAAEESAS
jgi:creatinine amidohydrolase